MPNQAFSQLAASVPSVTEGVPKPDPVDEMLSHDLIDRQTIAAQQASFHEAQAARFRAVERACGAALEQLGGEVPGPAPTLADLEYEPRFTVVEDDALDNTTTLVVRDAIFEQDDLVMNTKTGEVVIVDGVSGNAIACRRGVATSATLMAKGDELYRLGRAG